jgi:hypothetical protein
MLEQKRAAGKLVGRYAAVRARLEDALLAAQEGGKSEAEVNKCACLRVRWLAARRVAPRGVGGATLTGGGRRPPCCHVLSAFTRRHAHVPTPPHTAQAAG